MDPQAAERVVNELFETHGVFLLRYAYRRLRSAEGAEDVVQEAFLALHRDLRGGHLIHDPRGWLVGVVRNQIRKHARGVRLHGEDLTDPDAFDLMPAHTERDSAESPESRVASALDLLTPREEEVVLLRLQSLKYREIARRLGISIKSVGTLLGRAVRKIRDSAGPPHGQPPARGKKEVPIALR